MQGDFSVFHFDPHENDRGVAQAANGVLRNINGVLHQQGRVMRDADLTEGELIELGWEGQAGRDIIGSGVAAVPASEPNGFKIESAFVVDDDKVHVTVRPGRAWADGILTRLAGTATDPSAAADPSAAVERLATYLGSPPAAIGDGTRDAVILEVSQEALHGFQYPDRLIEPALGGPDTAERAFVNFRFRLLRLGADEDCGTILGKLKDDPSSKGKLTVELAPVVEIARDCPVVGGGGYTGFEHNLYRIEIAETSGPARFKWSQWNGGLVGRGSFAANRVSIDAGRAAIVNSGLTEFYLEVLQYDELAGTWNVTYGAMATLNGDHDLELTVPPVFGAPPSMNTSVFFRLWNGIERVSTFANALNPVELRDGIRLVFDASAAVKYRSGDYWIFAVRAGEIANPAVLIDNAPPTGIVYHRVPLAEITWTQSGRDTTISGSIEDCRHVFRPLTKQKGCCTYTVGDGLSSHGDFDSIAAALRQLPLSGGEICVLPGTYRENVRINRRANITIHGCGQRSRVVSRPPEGELATAAPVIHVRNSRNIRITGLAVEAHETGVGILIDGQQPAEGPSVDRITAREIMLAELWVTAGRRSAIEAHGVREVTICNSRISMRDLASPWPGIYFEGDDSLIERNDIRVVSPSPIERPGRQPTAAAAGLGGIQIGGGSERVRVLDNLIRYGIGNGITLGSVRIVGTDEADIGRPVGWVVNADDPCNPCLPGDSRIPLDSGDSGGRRIVSAGPLYDIRIAHNRIYDMGLNGIGVIGFFDLAGVDEMISVERLTILDNTIERCLRRRLEGIRSDMRDSMGYGAIALADVSGLVIHDNVLQNNGLSDLDPVCGIFVLHGEGIDICRNRILNNGARSSESLEGAHLGRRGGINIVYCVPPMTGIRISGLPPLLGQNGVPALRVHDNIVSAPLGQALMATALGPVSVQGNQFTSRGVVIEGWEFIAATVLILDLGISNEQYLQFHGFGGMQLGNIATNSGVAIGDTGQITIPGQDIDDLRVGRYLANGNVLFADNQCMLDLAESGWSLSLSSILILTLDDIAFHGNQCDCSLADDYVLSQAILAAWSLRVTDNRFKEGRFNAVFSAISLGVMNTTAGNQSTHCLFIRTLPPNPLLLVNGPNTELFGPLGSEVEKCALFAGVMTNSGNTGMTAGKPIA